MTTVKLSEPEWAHLPEYQDARDLLAFIPQAPTAYQAVRVLSERLREAGFTPYNPGSLAPLEPGDQGFIQFNGSALLAFSIGQSPLETFRLVGAHTDSPGLKIKPNPIVYGASSARLATEVYGGPLLNTWFDRPLSLAGRAALRSQDPLRPRLAEVDFKRPILILPSLAIHLNRQANDGVKIERQKVLNPILTLSDNSGADGGSSLQPDLLTEALAELLGTDTAEILDYDLFAYDCTPPEIIGLHQEFINAPRLDNLGLCLSAVQALIKISCFDGPLHRGIAVVMLTDNEEVGSRSKQGAASAILRDSLELLQLACGGDRQSFLRSLPQSFMISADQAHGVHPNYPEVADANCRPLLNQGPVIKSAANQSYTSDADSSAVILDLCQRNHIPCQRFVNRSDLPGGSTIGPVSSTFLPLRSVDVGNPLWAMHSIRETAGCLDQHYSGKLFEAFWQA
ncbi:MAG: M18 family aminopeptidase [Oscillospiraceae bacterium]|nr:M18 family aminopeptidase [Oscillospiraceae bacterium]MDD4367350.1 M18 family aminopeptidase [Oscillospiraceae bacterium]